MENMKDDCSKITRESLLEKVKQQLIKNEEEDKKIEDEKAEAKAKAKAKAKAEEKVKKEKEAKEAKDLENQRVIDFNKSKLSLSTIDSTFCELKTIINSNVESLESTEHLEGHLFRWVDLNTLGVKPSIILSLKEKAEEENFIFKDIMIEEGSEYNGYFLSITIKS